MKMELIGYKFLTFLLLPIAALFGVSVLGGLLSVFVNPTAILGVAIIGSIVAYIITCFIFIIKCIDGGKAYNVKLAKWITVTGSVTLFFCVLMIACYLMITSNPSILTEVVKQGIPVAAMPPGMEAGQFVVLFREMLTIFMVIGLVLILHLIMSFRIIPKFKNQYPDEKMDIEQ